MSTSIDCYLLKPGQQIRTFTEAVEHYAQLGLRTLCLAWRELKEDEYREWSLMFKEANSTLVDREVTQYLTIAQLLCFFFFFLKGTQLLYIILSGPLILYISLQWRIAEVCQMIEHDLEILGVTAIEDHLQVIPLF